MVVLEIKLLLVYCCIVNVFKHNLREKSPKICTHFELNEIKCITVIYTYHYVINNTKPIYNTFDHCRVQLCWEEDLLLLKTMFSLVYYCRFPLLLWELNSAIQRVSIKSRKYRIANAHMVEKKEKMATFLFAKCLNYTGRDKSKVALHWSWCLSRKYHIVLKFENVIVCYFC